MTVIEGYERIRPPVHRSLQHNFIRRVPQLRAPQEPRLHRLYQFDKMVQEHVNVSGRQSGRQDMFNPVRDSFIFDK